MRYIFVSFLFQELRFAHEELIKQKTAFQSRLSDRDADIEKLRNQVQDTVVHFHAIYD